MKQLLPNFLFVFGKKHGAESGKNAAKPTTKIHAQCNRLISKQVTAKTGMFRNTEKAESPARKKSRDAIF